MRELIVKYRGEPEKSDSAMLARKKSCVVQVEALAANAFMVEGSLAEITEAIRRAATQ